MRQNTSEIVGYWRFLVVSHKFGRRRESPHVNQASVELLLLFCFLSTSVIVAEFFFVTGHLSEQNFFFVAKTSDRRST